MKTFEKHNAEAQKRWGKTDAYREFSEKAKDYTEEKHASLADGMNAVFAEFALCMKNGRSTDSEDAQALVARLQSYITENYYTCTKEILSGLGQMYISDERFKENIDKHADGTAEFVSRAIENYCK